MIYLIMAVQFKSLLSPFIIIFTVPLAFTGGMLGLMAFSQDAGNAMQKGMAVVVCFGLLYATLMTLFSVPVLYDVFYRRPLRNIDLGKETENIPDETEAVLEEYGYAPDAAATAEEHA